MSTPFKPGYTYHIQETYFQLINSHYQDIPTKLMSNKENGHTRPTFFCIEDPKTTLFWMVPLSSKFDKYQLIYTEKVANRGSCDTIVLGQYNNHPQAFLLQNMFPVIPKYISHIHTINGNPIPVHSEIQKNIQVNFKKIMTLKSKNIQITMTDIVLLEKIMLDELNHDLLITPAPNKPSIKQTLESCRSEAMKLNAQRDQNSSQAKSNHPSH